MVIITCLGLRKCPEPDDRAVETEHVVLATTQVDQPYQNILEVSSRIPVAHREQCVCANSFEVIPMEWKYLISMRKKLKKGMGQMIEQMVVWMDLDEDNFA